MHRLSCFSHSALRCAARLGLPLALAAGLLVTAAWLLGSSRPAAAVASPAEVCPPPLPTDCNGYPCYASYDQFKTWDPASADKRMVASVPLAPHTEITGPRVLLGLDFGGSAYHVGWTGSPQGGYLANVYTFEQWQYVDTAYYYRHTMAFIPTVQWTNLAHRNGVRMLGTLTSDVDCSAGLNEFFTTENLTDTVDQLAAMATFYGFDGWMVDIERDARPTAEIAQALHLLRARSYTAVYYQAYVKALTPDDGTMALAQAAEAWQSDYDYSAENAYTTYTNLKDAQTGLTPFRAYGAANLYAGEHPYEADGTCTEPTWWDNGNACNDWQGILTALTQAMTDTAPMGAWTSIALYAPHWPIYGGSPGPDAPHLPARAVWRPMQEQLWNGTAPSGQACATSTSGGIAQYIAADTPLVRLPFVTHFNRGMGDSFMVDGVPVAASPWNHLGAQDVLPTFLCRTVGAAGDLQAAYVDGVGWDGANALQISGTLPVLGAAEYALWDAQVPLGTEPVLRFRYLSSSATAPYIRLSYADGSVSVVDGGTTGPEWTEVTANLPAGRTLVRLSVGYANRTAAPLPIAAYIGEIMVAARSDLTPPESITLPPDAAVLTWPAASSPLLRTNVWAKDAGRGCLHFLGPAFTNTYDLSEPLFPPADGMTASEYIVQPVNAAGVESPLPAPVCTPSRIALPALLRP